MNATYTSKIYEIHVTLPILCLALMMQSSKQSVVHQQPPILSEELPNFLISEHLLMNCQWLIGLIFIAWTLIDQFAHFSHTLSLSLDKHLPLRKTKNYPSDG